MKNIRVLSVVGSRPEGIKMAPVIKALEQNSSIDSVVCTTSQHREMLDQVLKLFDIEPNFDLNLMRPNQSLAELSASIFTSLDNVIAETIPNWVLVQGDTTTVAISSLVAYYRRVKVGHVEAGLRSRDKWQPFPEEINRRVAGVVADMHFAPTKMSKNNLLEEGLAARNIVVTGNTVIDALKMIAGRPPTKHAKDVIEKISKPTKEGANPRIILVTAHRRENFGEPIEQICKALKKLAKTYGDACRFVYPVHLNPNIKGPVEKNLSNVDNIYLLPPQDYVTLVHIMKNSILALTDSGGIQEEAPGLGIPVLVLREVTERPEGVDAGTVKLVGTSEEAIVEETMRLLDNDSEYRKMSKSVNPYGDGKAAGRIVKEIVGAG